jgi:DNA polymerase-3 subunit beta
MKFYCKQQDILTEIVFSMDFTQQRSSLSILSNIYLEAKNNTLLIKATDNATGFTTQIPAQTEEEGSTTVYGEKFLEILRLLPSDADILFETQDRQLTITPQGENIKFKSTLRVIDGAEFPMMENPGDVPFFTLGQKPFIGMADQTLFSVSTDETRHYLCGLYLEKTAVGLNLIATDGRRLSIVERKFSEQIPEFKPIIIPTKFFTELKKLSTGEGTFDLCIKENVIFAKIGNRFFYSTLIKGQYPDYRRVVPQNQTSHCLISVKEMVDAIKRVSVAIESKVCKLYLQISKDELTLYSEENELGAASEKIPCEYEGETCTISLNYQYILAPLKVMEGEKFTLNFTTPSRAITLCPEGEHDYFHLVMPMQPNS